MEMIWIWNSLSTLLFGNSKSCSAALFLSQIYGPVILRYYQPAILVLYPLQILFILTRFYWFFLSPIHCVRFRLCIVLVWMILLVLWEAIWDSWSFLCTLPLQIHRVLFSVGIAILCSCQAYGSFRFLLIIGVYLLGLCGLIRCLLDISLLHFNSFIHSCAIMLDFHFSYCLLFFLINLPMMPIEYLFFWYLCYIFHLFRGSDLTTNYQC